MERVEMTRRRRAFAILVAACVVAIACVAMMRSGRAPTAIDRDVVVAASETTPADVPLLPGVDESRSSIAVVDTIEPTTEPPVRGPQVHGILVLPRQFPVADGDTSVVTVHAWPVRDDGSGEYDEARRESFERVGGVCSGDVWHFDVLPPGRWAFVARSTIAGRRAVGVSEDVTLVEDQESGPVTIVLEEFFVEGRVTDVTGAPIAGLSIVSARTTTNWRMETLAPARARIGDREKVMENIMRVCRPIMGSDEGAQAMVDALTEDMIADFADLELEVPEDFESGTFIDEHAEQLGQILTLWNDRWLPGHRSPKGDGFCVTDEDGRYRIPLDGPGHVQLWAPARARVVSSDGGSWTTRQAELDLYPFASAAEQDFVLQRTASLVGRMGRSDGGVMGELFVFVYSLADPTDGEQADLVKGDRYWFQRLAAGRYSVFARCGGADGRAQTLCTEVELAPGEALTFDGAMTPSGRMGGNVVDGAGAAAVGVTVSAHVVGHHSVIRKGTTDARGRFTIEGLYPCSYDLEVDGQSQHEGAPIVISTSGATIDAGTIVIDR